MRVSTERGSVVGFVLVAVALVLVASGVIYWAKQQPDGASPDVAINTTDNNDSSDEQKQEDSNSDSSDKATSGEGGSSSGSDSSSDNSGSSSTDSPSGSSSNNSSVDAYSQTGPADTLAQLVAVGALSGASAAYLQSRRSHA